MGKRGAAGGAGLEAALKLRSFGGKGEAEAALRELCKKGPPEEREAAAIERDLADGYVSAEAVARDYGHHS